MNKKQIQIMGYNITQVNETEYEAENIEQNLLFHFDTGNPAAVEIFVYDNQNRTQDGKDTYITTFYAADLDDAVSQAMAFTKRGLEGTKKYYKVVETLRSAANQLETTPDSETKKVVFLGWREDISDGNDSLIQNAARAILAEGVKPDAGTYVSYKDLAALLHYVADMME